MMKKEKEVKTIFRFVATKLQEKAFGKIRT